MDTITRTLNNWRESAAEYLEGEGPRRKRRPGRPRKEKKALAPMIKKTAERYKECDCCGEMRPDVQSVFIGYLGDTNACRECRGG